jgi:DnaK suppressor protein
MYTGKTKEFQQALETKRRELLSGTSEREEIRIENAADEFDRLQQQQNREVAIRNLDRQSKLLKNVEAAIARIGEGTFGICVRCGEEIPEKRLRAIPWAAYCIPCQKIIDRVRVAGETEDPSNTAEFAS